MNFSIVFALNIPFAVHEICLEWCKNQPAENNNVMWKLLEQILLNDIER